MAKITEDYVSFEIAKLLKEKGFDTPCDNCYDSSGKTPNESVYGEANIETLDYNADPFVKSGFHKFKTFSAPTIQMAMKWLREVHNIFIEISVSIDLNGNYHYHYSVLDKECKYVRKGYTDFDWDYEQAAETAIKYCLENLI